MISVCILMALARSIVVISTNGHILDTFLHILTQSMGKLHPILATQAMFVTQMMLNFFIPSGSGQAVLTMPIMVPLGDLLHVSRQAVILAFQFGDGWGNPILPTAPVTMGALALAGISYPAWVKWFMKLEVLLIGLSLLLLIPAYYMLVWSLGKKSDGGSTQEVLRRFPFPVLIVVAYLCLGFGFHLWHPGWLVFLLIPLYYSLIPLVKDEGESGPPQT